jgi:lipoprotein-anchoring transpeptidase ErfK/SrfK
MGTAYYEIIVMRKYVFLILIPLLIGIFSGLSHLSYGYGSQDPVNPNTLTGAYDSTHTVGTYFGQTVYAPNSVADSGLSPRVLGTNSANKRIEVDLTNQHLYAFEGNAKVYDFLISSGKWYPTPTGEFAIWIKLRYTKMEGGNRARGTYYNLPNVPYTMFFAGGAIPQSAGFGIHGAYWHNNFGHPMSHGCVNMKTAEAGILYAWADPDTSVRGSVRASVGNPGTRVIIYGQAPI